MSLYLKYRPKNINELDLKSVRDGLEAVASSGSTSHAYLFDGPRGSGKTSAARILAKMVTCEKVDDVGNPCGKCGVCLSIADGSAVDIVEIDAASNRGIDDIRDLKQKIGLVPSSLRRKVYIIDEAHMLTTEAFNALLKTLEEPPEHAVFVLCTTESHALPETIISRCMRIRFSKANEKEMLRSLKRVVKGEKAKIDEEALVYLAQSVDGSFRDGVKILDQVLGITKGRVSKDLIEKLLYGASGYDVMAFTEALVAKDTASALELVQSASKSGVDISYVLRSTMSMVRDGLLSLYGVGKSEFSVSIDEIGLVRLLDSTAQQVSKSSTPYLLVEMAVIEWCEIDSSSPPTKIIEDEEEEEVEESLEDETVKNIESSVDNEVSSAPLNGISSMDAEEIERCWRILLDGISNNYSLEALLASARIKGVEDGALIVEVRYDFHRQQLESERFRSKVEELAKRAFSQPVKVGFVVGENMEVTASELRENEGDVMMSEPESQEDELVRTAQEVFDIKN